MSCHFWEQIASNLPSGVCWTLWSCSVQATFGSKTCWSRPTKKKNMTKNVVSYSNTWPKQNFQGKFRRKVQFWSLEISPFPYFSPFSCMMKKRGTGPLAQDLVPVIHPSFERCFQKERGLLSPCLEVRECWFWWSQGTYTSSSGKSVLDLPVGCFRKELPTSFPIDNPRSSSLVVLISVDHQLIWRIFHFSWHLS